MVKTILGIDCSSTCIGYCVLELDEQIKSIKFVKADYIKPIKTGSIVERIVNTRDKIQKIIEEIKPDYVAIEDIIKFMKGKSTAQTIIMLTTFNRMTALVAYDFMNKEPEFYNVMSIRHGLKFNKIFPKKEDMPELVAKHLGIDFPYEYNKNNKIRVENYDKADGMAVALYATFVLSGKIKRKIKSKKNETK